MIKPATIQEINDTFLAILEAVTAVTAVHLWRKHRLVDTLRATNPEWQDASTLEGVAWQGYTNGQWDNPIEDAFLQGKDIASALFLVLHTQLLSRPLGDIAAQHLPELSPLQRLKRIEETTETYAHSLRWQEGEVFFFQNMLNITTPQDAENLLAMLQQSHQAITKLLTQSPIDVFLHSSLQQMQLLGSTPANDAHDPLHLVGTDVLEKGAGLDKSNWLGLSNGKKTLQNRWLQAKQVA